MPKIALINHRILWVLVHSAAIIFIVLAIFYGYGWWLLAAFLISRVWIIGGMSMGLHRYFSHRSFTTTPFKHKIILFLSIMAAQGSPLGWATVHRHHHKHSDREFDVHSPKDGAWHGALWMLGSPKKWKEKLGMKFSTVDLLKDKSVVFVEKYYYVFWAFLIAVSFLIDWKIGLFLVLAPPGLGFMLDMYFVNYLTHTPLLPKGYRNFDSNDTTWNYNWVIWLGIPDGLHHNHHTEPWKTNAAIKKGEYDVTGWIIDNWFATSHARDVKLN